MMETNQHIVSKISWDTSFDNQGLAIDLQSNISKWSKHRMEQEIIRVFDNVCPPEQVWKIDRLVLDLGEIEYYDLQRKLTKLVPEQLTYQLKYLLFNSNGLANNIEITDTRTTHLSVIKSFLIQGYLPWWYKTESGNVHQLTDDQIKNNKAKFIEMIRLVGKSSSVRMRMAWQFTEASVLKIIEALEPNNHKQIIEFTTDLIKVQEEKKIIKSRITEFRKEAWFWVLSHLLTERGTLFNKVAFMKSMLGKMSARFNLKYNELLDLIEEAVTMMAHNSHVQSDFITTLKELSAATKTEKNKIAKRNKKAPDFWDLLDNYLSNKTTKSNKVSTGDFNDLIINLSKKDNSRFVQWLSSVKETPRRWNKLFKSINQSGYSAALRSITPVQSSELLHQVNTISSLTKTGKVKFEQKILWEISLNYLLNNVNNSIQAKDHIQNLINELSERKKGTKATILNQLTAVDKWAAKKLKLEIELFQDLTTIEKVELFENDTKVFSLRLTEILDKLIGLENTEVSTTQFETLKAALIKCIYSNPSAALAILLKYEHKDRLSGMLNLLFEDYHAHLIISEYKSKTADLLIRFQEVLNELKQDSQMRKTIELFDEQVMMHGLQVMLDSPRLTGIKFIEKVLSKVSKLMSSQQLEIFNKILNKLFAHDRMNASIFSETQIVVLKNKFRNQQADGVIGKMQELIFSEQHSKLEIAQFLLRNFSDEEFTKARKSNSPELKTILEHFFAEAYLLKTPLVTKAQRTLSSLVNNGSLLHDLLELYWICVLNYADYNGGKANFETAFNNAIAFKFNRNTSRITPHKDEAKEFVQLKSGESISKLNLRNIVTIAIKDASNKIEFQNKTFDLIECLSLALEVEPGILITVLSKVSISDKRIKSISAAISIKEFCQLLSQKAEFKTFFKSMLSLVELVDAIAPSKLRQGFYKDFWTEIWLTIQSTRMNQISFSRLVNKVIFDMAEELGEKASYFLAEINAKQIPITNLLKAALAKEHEVFELLPEPTKQSTKVIELEKCDQLGLLEELAQNIMLKSSVPSWFSGIQKYKLPELLNAIIEYDTRIFLKILKHSITSKNQIKKIASLININVLVNVITNVHPNLSSTMSKMLLLHKNFGQLHIAGITGKQMQRLLMDKILLAWSKGNWHLITADKFWNEMMWEICTKRGIKTQVFLTVLHNNNIAALPQNYQTAFKLLLTERKEQVLPQEIINEGILEMKEIIHETPAIIKIVLPCKMQV